GSFLLINGVDVCLCGICGFSGFEDEALLGRMLGSLVHRGPDDEGRFVDGAFSLGHRRLSIIDLDTGHQPIHNEDETLWIVYNGEVYNYRELREELEAMGHSFYTRTDTEVLLHAYEEFGEDCVKRFNGMFALAIFDRTARRLFLARDHFGIKPLYYHYDGDKPGDAAGSFLFASEIKALLEWPGIKRAPDDEIVYEYLLYGWHEHRPETFFQGIKKLPAAHFMVVDETGMRIERYWDISSEQASAENDFPHQAREFGDLLEDSVQRRLISDVPVGSCLSGGLDSSAIVCIMERLLKKSVPESEAIGDRLKTFSAVYPGEHLDEREYIDEVLRETDAEGNFIFPANDEFFAELEKFVYYQEEPLVSTGPYAQWCVMRDVARKVKVVIDGQGADELMAGYTPYFFVYFQQLKSEHRYISMLREMLAARDVALPFFKNYLSDRFKPGRKVAARSLMAPDFHEGFQPDRRQRHSGSGLRGRLYEDVFVHSLPALLRYEDKNSMAFSVESRVPFLDPRLVEYIFSLPPEAIIGSGWNKRVMREALAGILPEKIRRRRWKVGFTTPEMAWLIARKDFVNDIFRSDSFISRPYFDSAAVRNAFERICDGTAEETLAIWRVLNLEIWLRVFFDKEQ
ncbi:MAG: asparagine synthase (glutamine-hydrolyzing), partial [Thermoleophilia bacterium]|nr:asparagine synthase (glutamine-hydrolyzing) [Thermoleophilia bacterium]